jgi:hypothetical protein
VTPATATPFLHTALRHWKWPQGCTLNKADHCGDPPLILAAGNGHLAVVKLLLEEGADLEQRNVVGQGASQQQPWCMYQASSFKCLHAKQGTHIHGHITAYVYVLHAYVDAPCWHQHPTLHHMYTQPRSPPTAHALLTTPSPHTPCSPPATAHSCWGHR